MHGCGRQRQPAARTGQSRPAPELTVEEFATVMRTSPLGRHLSANKQNLVKPQPAPPKPPTVPGNNR